MLSIKFFFSFKATLTSFMIHGKFYTIPFLAYAFPTYSASILLPFIAEFDFASV